MSKLRTRKQGGGSTHLCSFSEWMTTRCGTRSWAWGARLLSPHRPLGLLWLAAPHQHLARGKIRQVGVCPGLYPVRARQAAQGKSRAEAGKAGVVCSEASVVITLVHWMQAASSPFLPLKHPLPFPAETISQTHRHVKSQSALLLQQETTLRPT